MKSNPMGDCVCLFVCLFIIVCTLSLLLSPCYFRETRKSFLFPRWLVCIEK